MLFMPYLAGMTLIFSIPGGIELEKTNSNTHKSIA